MFSVLFGLFWVPFWLWVLGAVVLFCPSGFFVCVSVFFLFYESDSYIFDFCTIFVVFLIFLFIFALTFHKCQFVKKAFLFIFIFWPFLKWGLFFGSFFGFGFGLFWRFLGCWRCVA